MSQTLSIQAQKVGVQSELFTVTYTTIGGGDTRTAALDTSDNSITTITRQEVLNGYLIVVPNDVSYIFLCVYGGPSNGTCYSINVPGVSPSPSLTPSLTLP